MRRSTIAVGAFAGLIAGCGGGGSSSGDYAIDDGTAETLISIDPGEDTVWLNAFPVESGHEVIRSVSVSFGRPSAPQALDGLPITILLYEVAAGASPQSAVLKQSVAATVANANTGQINVYEVPPTELHGAFLAGVLFRNQSADSKGISALDRSAPKGGRSYYGFAAGLNEADLSTIAAGQFGTIESLGTAGNWIVRATGTAR
jgi:hypothetical protein